MNFPHSQMCTEPPVPAGRSCESGFSLRYPRKSWNYRYPGQSYKPHPVNTSQMRCREAAQADIVCQFSMDILYLCILLFEFQIFLKRKRIDTEGNISSGRKSLFPKTSFWNWSLSHKGQHHNPLPGVYHFLPAFNFLNLIQKEIRSPSWI